MENEKVSEPVCDGKGSQCKWIGHPKLHPLICVSGSGGCNLAKLLEAEESDFHTAELVKATKAINEILATVSENGNCKLSFIDSGQGIMLAWVEHGGTP
ncbi:MAG: hypothetical protein ABI686_12385, partial [Acidobacteriota bacterium]